MAHLNSDTTLAILVNSADINEDSNLRFVSEQVPIIKNLTAKDLSESKTVMIEKTEQFSINGINDKNTNQLSLRINLNPKDNEELIKWAIILRNTLEKEKKTRVVIASPNGTDYIMLRKILEC